MSNVACIGTYQVIVQGGGDVTQVLLHLFRLPRQTQIHAGWSLPDGRDARYVGSYPFEDLAVRESRQQVLLNLRADFPDVSAGAPQLIEEDIALPEGIIAAAEQR